MVAQRVVRLQKRLLRLWMADHHCTYGGTSMAIMSWPRQWG
jgi:hypothetical protein